ncbi:MAG: ABC transporter permease [Bacteriovoracaceae bacterium]
MVEKLVMTKNGFNWQQIKILTLANMKARYRKTIIGFFWVVLNPIIMYSVQAFVFQRFLKIDLHNYYLFLLGGLLPWIFITSSWDSSTPSIVSSSNILKSFQISPLIILSSAILDNFINFLTAFTIIVIPTLIISQNYSLNLLFLPIALILLMSFTLISTAILATLHVFYRDIKYVTNFTMSLLFFLTPIFYPVTFIPPRYQWIVDLNPLYMVIAPFRASLYGGTSYEISIMLLKSLSLTVVLAVLFNKIWNDKKNELFLKL